MKIYIFSLNSYIFFKEVKILRLFFNKKSYSVMNNYVPTIGSIDHIYFLDKKKKNFFLIKDGYFIVKHKILNIICDYYEFLQ